MPPLIIFWCVQILASSKTIKGGHYKMPLLIIFAKTIKGGHFKMPPLIVFSVSKFLNLYIYILNL